jgi:hypothetical protein
VTLTRRSSLADVAAVVATALRQAGFRAVLTGGACAAIYSDGACQSQDLDFVVQSGGSQRALDEALAGAGFTRHGDRYAHPRTRFFVEFPRGPLAIGGDAAIVPVELTLATGKALALSATDSVRDRLAAFYHWSDRGSLHAAVAIARRRRVNMAAIRRWSAAEGHPDRFREFELAVAARTRYRRRSAR